MNPTVIGLVVFACTFLGALLGLVLQKRLPKHHLDEESRRTVNVGVGLVATMTALVLGLITASAKRAFDDVDTAVRHAAADILALDRLLAQYGPETAEIRSTLAASVEQRYAMAWPEDDSRSPEIDPADATPSVELLASSLRALEPQTEDQRWLLEKAMELGDTMLQSRWRIFVGTGGAVPVPFLVVVIAWLALSFTSFGLFSTRNGTVIAVLFLCALSVAAAVFLVLELEGAFEGVIRVSPEPMRYALAHLNQ